MNTKIKKAIILYLKDGNFFHFKQCDDGLYYYNVNDINISTNKLNNGYVPYSVSFLNYININKQIFIKDELWRIERVRDIQQVMRLLLSKVLKNHITNNFLRSCEITLEDIDKADFACGKPVPILKGRMTSPSIVKHENRCI